VTYKNLSTWSYPDGASLLINTSRKERECSVEKREIILVPLFFPWIRGGAYSTGPV
jgi:hypothetical protein